VTLRPRLLVIRHEAGAPPGLLGDAAERAGVELEVVAADAGEPVPRRLDGAAGLVVLGGMMGVADVAEYPHLEPTMGLIRGAAAEGAPTLGICLGAQLAAQALGGRAYKSPDGLELGWIGLQLTPAGRADPVTAVLDHPNARVFSSHYDVFDLPAGATLLARGADRPNQAFRLGSVVGVQFHPEVDAALVAAWHAGERELVDGAVRHAPRARRVLDAFCRTVARGAPSPGPTPAPPGRPRSA
jgi:GMP synthase (glutamine-hydrolysing)